jgi:hypothetical protein
MYGFLGWNDCWDTEDCTVLCLMYEVPTFTVLPIRRRGTEWFDVCQICMYVGKVNSVFWCLIVDCGGELKCRCLIFIYWWSFRKGRSPLGGFAFWWKIASWLPRHMNCVSFFEEKKSKSVKVDT